MWEITQPNGLRCREENSIRKRDEPCVGAGVPAKNPARCLAPATPVFAGNPPSPIQAHPRGTNKIEPLQNCQGPSFRPTFPRPQRRLP
ncbi:hypothetical protein EGJ15_24840 [Pseudomonas sp. p99-361]|nr:hypothetical protein EGJ15_24840 [Pseudomonas sp. p99-361]